MCCRIDDKNQVKVADFGLSHQLFEREYYSSKDHKAKLPIKWMALESLEDFVFTAKSDVVCSQIICTCISPNEMSVMLYGHLRLNQVSQRLLRRNCHIFHSPNALLDVQLSVFTIKLITLLECSLCCF